MSLQDISSSRTFPQPFSCIKKPGSRFTGLDDGRGLDLGNHLVVHGELVDRVRRLFKGFDDARELLPCFADGYDGFHGASSLVLYDQYNLYKSIQEGSVIITCFVSEEFSLTGNRTPL